MAKPLINLSDAARVVFWTAIHRRVACSVLLLLLCMTGGNSVLAGQHRGERGQERASRSLGLSQSHRALCVQHEQSTDKLHPFSALFRRVSLLLGLL